MLTVAGLVVGGSPIGIAYTTFDRLESYPPQLKIADESASRVVSVHTNFSPRRLKYRTHLGLN